MITDLLKITESRIFVKFMGRIKSNRFVYSSLMNYSQSQKWVCQDASLGARPQAPGKVAALQRSTASCEAGQRNYSAPLQMLGIHHFLFLRVIH